MSNVTKTVIQLIPMLMYIAVLFWTNKLINNKIKNKPNRKKYKKYFNKELGLFFFPFMAGTALLLFAFNKPTLKETLPLINFILRFIVLLTQIILAVMVFPKVRQDISDIRILDEPSLIGKIDNN